jgi:hypothetical protein
MPIVFLLVILYFISCIIYNIIDLMLFSELHNYNHKYVIVVLLAIQIGLILFLAFTSNNVLDAFTPLQPKIWTNDNSEQFYPCNNFCGPKGECAITREQCVANFECADCIKDEVDPDSIIDVPGYNSSFLEGFSNANANENLPMYNSPETSSLTTDSSDFATVIEKGKGSNVPKMNLGVDLWTKAFNYGLSLEKRKNNYDFVMYPGELEYKPKYNVTKSVTGMFDDFGPTAANATL